MEIILKIFAGTLSVSASITVTFAAFAAFAQSNAAEYCSALVTRYQTYLRSTDQQVGVAARIAIDECKAGDTKSGIPVLERRLKNAGIELPAHG